MYRHMHTCIHTYKYAYIHTYIYTWIHIYLYTDIPTHILPICMHMYMHGMCLALSRNILMCVCVYHMCICISCNACSIEHEELSGATACTACSATGNFPHFTIIDPK